MLKMPFDSKPKTAVGLLEKGEPQPDWPARLTHWAFLLATILVAARALMQEIVRDAFAPTAGPTALASLPGPATSLLLDLLCCVPSLLVLLRRAIDRTYIIRFAPSHAIMGALAIWIAGSALWASDRFAAVVAAANFIAALALLWAALQLVRSYARLRFVAAAVFAVLVIYVAAGLNQRLLVHPVIVRSWLDPNSETSRWHYIKDHNLTESDFQFKQFESNLLTGSLQLFGTSANTYAAALVLLTVVALGLILHRLTSRDRVGWIVALLVPLPAAVFCLYHTHSLTAFVTPLLAAVALLQIHVFRNWLSGNARKAYWLGVIVFCLGFIALVAHGLYHNSLVVKTLTYRWYYWTGAASLVAQHPFVGVGFASFGDHYPAVRQAIATEVVKDPHNVIVRFFAELGLIGGLLLVAWMLRMWWELTRPVTPPPGGATPLQGGQRGILFLAIPAVLIAAFNLLFSVDFSAHQDYVFQEIAYRGITIVLLLAALAAAAFQSLMNERLDERPCPWVLHGILVAIGIFLIHNLIDFSFFEPGPMFLFALLAGSALGIRHPSVAGRKRRDRPAFIGSIAALVVWLAAAAFVFAPVYAAESAAEAGDAAMRTRRFTEAAAQYVKARSYVRYNSDYTFRAAQALVAQGAHHDHALGAIELAIQSNPRVVKYHVYKAEYELAQPQPDPAIVKEAYERSVRLNPHDTALRLAYAEALVKLNDKPAAVEQYRQALKHDAALPADEPKRLSKEKRAQIEKAIQEFTRAG